MDGQTLQAGLDHVERVDGERGDGAGGQAGDGLDQRGREGRMVFVHKGGGVVDFLMAWCLRRESRNDDVEAGKIKYFGDFAEVAITQGRDIAPPQRYIGIFDVLCGSFGKVAAVN
jgi:hypothetical protein